MLSPQEITLLKEMCFSAGTQFSQLMSLLMQHEEDVRSDPRFADLLGNFSTQSHLITPGTADKIIEPSISFGLLKRALNIGTCRQECPIGSILPDTWTDPATGIVYDAPLRIVDYRKRRKANGDLRMAATLLRVYAHPILVQFDAPEKPGAPESRDRFGWNRWEFAGVRQYLNTRGTPGEWGKPTHEWDVPLEIAATQYGYLAGCSQELKGSLGRARIALARNHAVDKPFTEDYFFLPTDAEVHFDSGDDADFEQDTWEYFLDTSSNPYERCEKRVFTDQDDASCCVWLRSASRSYAYSECSINSDGWHIYDSAYNFNRVAPACVIFSNYD